MPAEWHVTSARNETRVTCEPCPCQSRPSPLSQASAVVRETFINHTNQFDKGSLVAYTTYPDVDRYDHSMMIPEGNTLL